MKRLLNYVAGFAVVYLGSLVLIITIGLLAGCADTEQVDTPAQTEQWARREQERVGR